ncbi:hypothetical protein [Spongiactinospora sp. 9N601]|uniref:hypothetical protein n=1 Tax=Spongiactinospora sp. 9N601 TaxID=3375149 RepID=UPI0037991786
MIKFNSLPANCVIFHTVMRQLLAEGWKISAEDLAQPSPYLIAHISRPGLYATDDFRAPAEAAWAATRRGLLWSAGADRIITRPSDAAWPAFGLGVWCPGPGL